MDFSPAQIWLALAIVLIIVEFSTMSFFLLWPGVAALILAVLCWVIPGLDIIWQFIIFAVISVALLIPGRKWVKGWMKSDGKTKLNNRANSLIGDNVTVVSVIGATLRVKHGDTEWSAKSNSKLKAGDIAKITATNGNELIISP